MKAAVLKALGTPLAVETVADPVLGTGEVIVDVVAAAMLAYARDVFSGKRQYLLELPIVPGSGGIGRVRAIGPDATRLAVGDWVMIDPTVRGRDDAVAPDIILQGLTAGSEAALRLQRYYHDGAFAEQVRVPTENAVPIGAIDPAEAGRWFALGLMLVPYGGLLAVDFRPGEILAVSGATGNFGGAAVMLALGMGASAVIALGRNTEALARLERRFGPRVRAVAYTGDAEADCARIKAAAPGAIDAVLDILPPQGDPAATRAAILSLREFGRAALMGGQAYELALPYNWLMRNSVTLRGQWMYPRHANSSLIALARAGQVDLSAFEIGAFSLDDIEAAIDHAAANAGAFKMTVLRPAPANRHATVAQSA